jgi:FAD/FMN-containing dehydrogenase
MLTTRTDLRAALPHGEVLVPSQPGWDAARCGYDTAADLHPAAVVVARSLADVQAATAFARARSLGIAPYASGHGAAALAPLGDSILLRTSELAGVRIDPEARVARVTAGTTWGRLARAAGRYGLTGLAGTHDSVGVVGYTRWAAGSAASRAATGWPAAACGRSSCCPPTGASCAPTPSTSPSCSGRCAAAARAWAW